MTCTTLFVLFVFENNFEIWLGDFQVVQTLYFGLCKYSYLYCDFNFWVKLTSLTIYTFAADEIYLNSRTFQWPHELEQVLELSGSRLNVVRENLEVALK